MMPEEWVIWAYRLFLDREPESSAIVRFYCDQDFSPQKLRKALLESNEFRALGYGSSPDSPEDAELRRIKAEFTVAGADQRAGFFTDFLGVQTRCEYLPKEYAHFSGAVEHADGSGVVPLHEAAETIALLRSAQETDGLFTIAELGAGLGSLAGCRRCSRPLPRSSSTLDRCRR